MKLCPTCQTKYPDDANFCPQEACATPDGPQRLQLLPDDSKPRFNPTTRVGGARTGEVWRARDNDSGAEVAYKIVAAEVLPTAAAQSRAEREFKQLMRVQSPRIATIIECGKAPDDRLFVAMELCEGPNLEQMLRGGPLSFDKARSIVGQVGQALLEAQKAGIVHRDVSPKNVIVTAGGEVKVINFPIATPVTEKVSGVPAYVSPEQAQGKPVDQRSNTYSLACIFYHLLTGEPPFQAANPQALLELHVSSPPLPPSQRRPEANLSPDIDRVILKALDKNSSRRHLTLRLFLTEVEALSAPGAAPAPAAASGNREVGFAKTMLFAGGQAEVASLVAKAIAARTGGGGHPTPAAGSPATAAAAAPVAAQPVPATMPLSVPANQPSAAVASTILAGGSNGQEAAAASSAHLARLTPPPVTPYPPSAPAASPSQTAVAATADASAAPAAAKAPSDDGKSGVKPAFRETLWFKRGDVDQMVAEAKAKMAGKGPEGEVPEDVRPLEDRYVDDGTVTTEDRKKFSLRAGGTATAVPSSGAKLPGAGMSDQEVIEEIAGPRRTMILVVAAVVVAAVIVVVLMMLRNKAPEAAAPAPKPAATAVAPTPAPTPPPPAPAPTPPPAAAAPAEPTPAAAPAAAAAAAAKAPEPAVAEPAAPAVAKRSRDDGDSAAASDTPRKKRKKKKSQQ
jgi:serine/threonine-protein kinase